jgi:outer membrane immunogenic protein
MLRSVGVAGAAGVLLLNLSFFTSQAEAAQTDPWSGFSVSLGGGGANVGADLGADVSNQDNFTFDFPANLLEFIVEGSGHTNSNVDGWEGFGTLQGAYDFRFGNILLGALADFDFYPGDPRGQSSSNIDGNFSINFNGATVFGPVPFPNYASATSSLELEKVWSVGGRLGYLITPSVLVYGLGGYTQASLNGQVDLSYFDLLNGTQTLSLRASDELRGYFVGAGGEMLITKDLALRLEYRYANYDGEMSSASASSGASVNLGGGSISYGHNSAVQADLDAQIQSIRGAIVLKLGEP